LTLGLLDRRVGGGAEMATLRSAVTTLARVSATAFDFSSSLRLSSAMRWESKVTSLVVNLRP
jgi:hypothetical protein